MDHENPKSSGTSAFIYDWQEADTLLLRKSDSIPFRQEKGLTSGSETDSSLHRPQTRPVSKILNWSNFPPGGMCLGSKVCMHCPQWGLWHNL